MTKKHFICISIKHTYYSNSGWVLWCKNKSGYTWENKPKEDIVNE